EALVGRDDLERLQAGRAVRQLRRRGQEMPDLVARRVDGHGAFEVHPARSSTVSMSTTTPRSSTGTFTIESAWSPKMARQPTSPRVFIMSAKSERSTSIGFPWSTRYVAMITLAIGRRYA